MNNMIGQELLLAVMAAWMEDKAPLDILMI